MIRSFPSIHGHHLEDGTFSDQVLAHLEQKQRAGVEVRIMLDAYGGLKAPREKLSRLKALGERSLSFTLSCRCHGRCARSQAEPPALIVIDGAIDTPADRRR